MTEVDAASLRQSRQIAAALRGADQKIKARLRARLEVAVAPVKDEVRANARAILPKAGGLNEWAADRLTVYAPTTIGADSVSIAVTVSLPGHDLRSLERGRIFHRVYGRKMVGPQIIPSGFIAKTMKGPVALRARKALGDALQDVARDIAREARQ